MGNLQEQLAKIEQDLSAEKQKGPEGDQTIIARLESEQAHILEQIMLAEQQEREQQIEEKVTGDEITFNVPGVDFKQMPAELITLIDLVVRADRRRIYAEETVKADELDAKHKADLTATSIEIQSYKNQVESLQEIIRNGKSANESLIHENGNLRDHMAKVNSENADLQQKLDSAATQLDEANTEIGRLKSEIDDYQKAKVFGERDAQKIIDVTPQETADMQDLVNNIAKKYVSVTPIAANWHEAVAEDGSKTVVHTKDLPSLETQGSQFRGTGQAGNQETILPSVNQEVPFPGAPNVETVHAPGLGNQAQPTGVEMAEHSNDGKALAEQGVSREEHEALKSRVDALEGKVA